MSPARSAKRANVFLNLPFDAQHEKIYLALIAGLSALGLTPRCVLEIQPTSARLTRLLQLISSCEYSIHDLSRVQLSSTAPRCPRFNMPFELGMTIAWAETAQSNHYWIVLESKQYRLQKSLSDLNGYDHFVHKGTVGGVFQALLDAFDKPDLGITEMKQIYRKLRQFGVELQQTYRWNNLFQPSAFRRLVIAAAKIKSAIENPIM